MADFWAFLGDPHNQAILSCLGGGLVVLAGGAWTVFTYFRPSSIASNAESKPAAVTAKHQSVAAGGAGKSRRGGQGGLSPAVTASMIRAGLERGRGPLHHARGGSEPAANLQMSAS